MKRYATIINLFMLFVILFGNVQNVQAANKNHPTVNQSIPDKIPTLGITADGRYPVYKLIGWVSATIYVSGPHLYHNSDLVTRMVYILKEDALKTYEYQCDFICKNSYDQVVGLNPLYKGDLLPPMYKKPAGFEKMELTSE